MPSRTAHRLSPSLGSWALGCTLAALALGCSEFVDKELADTASPADVSCTPECAGAGRVECDPSGGVARRVCAAVDGCLQWQPAEACGADQLCRDGVCGADACPTDGATECRGDAGFERCRAAADGFLAWGDFSACTGGEICESGACVDPGAECPALGSRRCAGGGASVCKLQGGRLQWRDEACGQGTTCRGAGICGVDACALGQQRCEGALIAACAEGGDGFLAFAPAEVCPDAGVCRDLAPAFAPPQAHCGADDCALDTTRCGASGPEVCAADAQGFLKWVPDAPCAQGESCRDGRCGADACPAAGQGECVEGGLRVCALVQGFLAWSDPAPCVDGGCVAGACVQDQCPGAGATRCDDTTHAAVCGLDAASGLLAWGAPVPCPGAGTECRAQGVCGKDACPAAGDLQCATPTSTAICQLGTGPFLVWAPGEACGPGDACRDGRCGHDDCPLGAVECVDAAARRRCVDAGTLGGTPGFGAWGAPEACPSAEMACLDGVCRFDGPFTLAPGDLTADVAPLADGRFGVLQSGALTWTTYGADGLVLETTALGLTGESPRVTTGAPLVGVWVSEGLTAGALGPLGVPYPVPAAFPLQLGVLHDVFPSSDGPYVVRVEATSTGARLVGSPMAASGVLYSVEIAAVGSPVGTFDAAATASGAGAFVWVEAADPTAIGARRLDFAGGAVTPVIALPANGVVARVALAGLGEDALVVVEREGALEVAPLRFDAPDTSGPWAPVAFGRQPVLSGSVLLYRVEPGDGTAELWAVRVGAPGAASPAQRVDAGAVMGVGRAAVLDDGRVVVVYPRDGALRARFLEGL